MWHFYQKFLEDALTQSSVLSTPELRRSTVGPRVQDNLEESIDLQILHPNSEEKPSKSKRRNYLTLSSKLDIDKEGERKPSNLVKSANKGTLNSSMSSMSFAKQRISTPLEDIIPNDMSYLDGLKKATQQLIESSQELAKMARRMTEASKWNENKPPNKNGAESRSKEIEALERQIKIAEQDIQLAKYAAATRKEERGAERDWNKDFLNILSDLSDNTKDKLSCYRKLSILAKDFEYNAKRLYFFFKNFTKLTVLQQKSVYKGDHSRKNCTTQVQDNQTNRCSWSRRRKSLYFPSLSSLKC